MILKLRSSEILIELDLQNYFHPPFTTHASGKLLLTGEYAVLDGALALAVPVRYGQRLEVTPNDIPGELQWESIDCDGNTWCTARFSTADWAILSEPDEKGIAERLQRIFAACRAQNPVFCADGQGLKATITTDFPLNWGLGSSSTLIAAVAQWAEVNPYQLLEATFGGSGYDIACAYADGPLFYQLNPTLPPGQRETVTPVVFDPPFKDQLSFVYLGQKQDSREGIRRYRSMVQTESTALAAQISALSRRAIQAATLAEFEAVLLEHEHLIAQALGLPRAQDLLFPNVKGVVKSLGAWGGDFVLVTGEHSLEGAISWERMVGRSV